MGQGLNPLEAGRGQLPTSQPSPSVPHPLSPQKPHPISSLLLQEGQAASLEREREKKKDVHRWLSASHLSLAQDRTRIAIFSFASFFPIFTKL